MKYYINKEHNLGEYGRIRNTGVPTEDKTGTRWGRGEDTAELCRPPSYSRHTRTIDALADEASTTDLTFGSAEKDGHHDVFTDDAGGGKRKAPDGQSPKKPSAKKRIPLRLTLTYGQNTRATRNGSPTANKGSSLFRDLIEKSTPKTGEERADPDDEQDECVRNTPHHSLN
jgi:hypothetical protein